MEQTTQQERRIHIIPATKPATTPGQASGCLQRVAAYCRVSTDSEEQLTSYTAQKAYYTQKIGENPDWEMAGIFADRGITGTSLKKRTEFNRMIAACKRGRIDMILTKSLSRFARNTVDCLEVVRMLKANGIGVIFEKENINTLTESSEFLITLFSSFAQAESESISKNVSWGIQKSREAGKVPFQYQKLLGYRRGADGKPEIDPEEAEVVKRIYRRYLDGCSLAQIKTELEADGTPTASGIQGWTYQVVRNILTNEKYIGDALLQKTYTTDCISKTVKKNQGDRPMVYVEKNHPAIIPKAIFYQVREEMTRRSSKRKVMQKTGKTEQGKYSSKYALSELLVCGECGTPYKRCTWARNGKKRIVWRCISRLEFGTKYCHTSPTVDEDNPICPYYAIRAYFCNDSVAKRRGHQDFVPHAGAIFLWLYAGHLHSRHHENAGRSGGEDGAFYGDDVVEIFLSDSLPDAQKPSNTSSSVYPLMGQLMGHLMGQKIVPPKKVAKTAETVRFQRNFGTSIHNDTLKKPHKIKVFGSR